MAGALESAEEAIGVGINVLSGKEEARYAALGVIAGIPEADGIVGDLGGGSLELIDVQDGKLRDGITLPIGPLRLIDMSGGSIKRAKEIVDEYLREGNASRQPEGPLVLRRGRHLAKPGPPSYGAEQISAPCAAPLCHDPPAGVRRSRSRLRPVIVIPAGRARGFKKPFRYAALWCPGA